MRSDAEIHALIAQHLAATGRHAGWDTANPYTLRHLAEHANVSGTIDEIAGDTDYLSAATPAELIEALRAHPNPPTPALMYRRARHQMGDPHLTHHDRAARIALESALQGFAVAPPPNHAPWWPAWARTQPTPETTILQGHTGGVLGVAVGVFDGETRVVSASADGTVRVWDPVTGATTAVLEGHTGGVWGVAVGVFDGETRVVSASTDRTVRVWDPVTGATTAVLEGHTDRVLGVAVGVFDGETRVVSASADGTVRVWDPVTATTIATIPIDGALSVALDGTTLVVGLQRGLAVIELNM